MVLNNNEISQNVKPSTSKTRKLKPRTARQVHKQIKSTLTEDTAQSKSSKTARQSNNNNNKKITDFFSVRGRESFVKSPIVLGRTKSLIKLSRHNPILSTPNESKEVICLDDSDDCDSQGSNSCSSEQSASDDKMLTKLKLENTNMISSLPNLMKTRLNNDPSSRVDEDVEIVEMLPPIPLRDHPTYYVD